MRDTRKKIPLLAASALSVLTLICVLFGLPTFYLATIPVFFAVAVTVSAPWIGIIILVTLLPFNGLATDLLEVWKLPEVATIVGGGKDAILLTLLLVSFFTGRIRNARFDLSILVGLIMAIAAVAGLFAANLFQAAYGWRNDYEPLLLIVCVPVLLTAVTANRVAFAIIAVGEVSSGAALITWSLGTPWLFAIGRLPVAEGEKFPTSLFVAGSDWPRAFSPYTAPNEMAAAMLVTLAVIMCSGRWRWYARVCLAILPIAAIVAAQSRSGMLGIVAIAVVIGGYQLYRVRPIFAWILASLSAVVATVGVLLYTQANAASQDGDPSLGGHSASLIEALNLLLARPFGYGIGTVGPRAFRFSEDPILVESFVLLIALEAGLIVLLLYIALVVRLAQISLRSPALAGLVGAAAIGGTLVSQLVLPTLQEGAVSFLLWVVAGMGVVLARSEILKVKTLQPEFD